MESAPVPEHSQPDPHSRGDESPPALAGQPLIVYMKAPLRGGLLPPHPSSVVISAQHTTNAAPLLLGPKRVSQPLPTQGGWRDQFAFHVLWQLSFPFQRKG